MTGVLGGKVASAFQQPGHTRRGADNQEWACVASAFQQPGRVKDTRGLTPLVHLLGCIRLPTTRAGESLPK